MANVSIDTTERELKSIDGIPLSVFREHNINLLFGRVNAMSYGAAMFNFPTSIELLQAADADAIASI